MMKHILCATLLVVSLFNLYCLPVKGMKEEPEEDLITHRFTSNIYRGPYEDFFSAISPEDLIPLCSNMQNILKRGPTFNAWGGKKRTVPWKFGKRNPNSNPSSSQFNPWGGKRSDADDYLTNSDDKIAAAHL